jgi:opacity protein-like surface antigen
LNQHSPGAVRKAAVDRRFSMDSCEGVSMIGNRLAVSKSSLLIVALLGVGQAALANDAFIGVGIGLSPGQPRFKQSDDFPIQAAFELTPQDWRFGFMQATFDSNDKPTVHLNTQVFGAQKLFIHKFDNRFSLNGALGVGYYQVNLSGAGSGTGSAFGLMATGGGRFQITPQFFTDLEYQYRNAAISVNSNEEIDGGWTGFALNVGYVF